MEDVWEDERSVAKEWGSEGVAGVESEVEMCGRTRGLSESEGVESEVEDVWEDERSVRECGSGERGHEGVREWRVRWRMCRGLLESEGVECGGRRVGR